jgi:hypothetical protein
MEASAPTTIMVYACLYSGFFNPKYSFMGQRYFCDLLLDNVNCNALIQSRTHGFFYLLLLETRLPALVKHFCQTLLVQHVRKCRDVKRLQNTLSLYTR